MDIYSEAKIAPKGKLNTEDIVKMLKNILIFTAPAFTVFFAQLALGVEPNKAFLVALLGFYGVLADFFKKLNDGKN